MSSDQPITPRDTRHGVRLRIVWPLLIVVIAFLVASTVYGVLDAAGMSEDSAEIVAQLVSGVLILGLGLWRYGDLPRFERRFVRMAKTRLIWCVLIGIGLALVLRIVVGIVLTAGEQVDGSLCRRILELDDDIPTVMWHKVALAVALVALAPLGEELLFRGLLLRGLVRRMRFPAAALVSGVLFAVVHAQYWVLWPLLIGISIFGVVAAWTYRRFGFPANVALHAAFNAVAAIALFVDFDTDSARCD